MAGGVLVGGGAAAGREQVEGLMKGRGWKGQNGGSLHGEIVRGGLSGALAADETAPGLVALVDDLGGVLLVLRLTGERELVLGLAIGDLVDPMTCMIVSTHRPNHNASK